MLDPARPWLSQAANGLGLGDTTVAGITTPAEAACAETNNTAMAAVSSKLFIRDLLTYLVPAATRYRNLYQPSRCCRVAPASRISGRLSSIRYIPIAW